MNICKYCKKEFNGKTKGSTVCGCCSVSKRRWKNKLKYVNLLGGKCSKCGYDKHPGALEFHHLRDKEFTISANKLLWKDEKVLPELEKCELLCANCHNIEHSNYERFQEIIESEGTEKRVNQHG